MDLAECLATIATGTNKDMLQIDLTTLSVKDASKLAKHKGPLDFVGLTALSAQVATELAKHKGTLFLGLTTLSVKVATELAKHKGALQLGGLTINFSDVKSVAPEVAK